MEFRRVGALRGPNVWARFSVLEAWVDLGSLKDSASNEIEGFNERLMGWLPTMIEHRCSVGERGGFFQRLHRGTYLAHILEHVTLELQSLAGTPVGFGRARESAEDGVYKVAIQYREEELARACLETGRALCLAAVYDRPFDVESEITALRDVAHRVCLGPSTLAIVDAARARKIPTRRVGSDSLVVLGQGSKQRRIQTAETDRTGAIAQGIAQDKDLTRQFLMAVGVPTAWGRPVESAEDAWAAACSIGGPVVVKPRYGNHGRGVSTNLVTREQVIAAYEKARHESSYIVVETFAPGDDYRLLVIGDSVVAAARREPAHVIGDGVSTISRLIEIVNRDPRRGDGHATVLTKLSLDPIALDVLAEQGFGPDSVPPAAQKVLIRRNANLSTGGTAADVTDLVHPEVNARAVSAARVIGLDIAGIDVIANDISRPMEEQGGIVVEVNAGPGLRMHIQPSEGTPRPVGQAIVEMIYPTGTDGRIPVIGVTGVNGKTTTTRLIAHLFARAGYRVGMTCSDGIEIQGRVIEKGDCSGPKSARHVLLNPEVDCAVLETARGGILREGLGFDACAVGVVTNIGEADHLGINGIETPEELAYVKSTIVDVVLPTGAAVLNAADPLVSDMAKTCRGEVIYFSLDGAAPVLAAHLEKGGRGVFVRDNRVILARGFEREPLISLSKVPLTWGGRIGFQVENVLAAVAAAWAQDLPRDALLAGLEGFRSETEVVPGRFNVLDGPDGRTVIIDYAHNPSAVKALIEAVRTFPNAERTIIFSAAGDRRDVDIIRQAELLASEFDTAVLFEDQCNRGRPDGEIVALLRQGFEGAARTRHIHEVRGETRAVELGLECTRAGGLLVVQPDAVEETIAYLRRRLGS